MDKKIMFIYSLLAMCKFFGNVIDMLYKNVIFI